MGLPIDQQLGASPKQHLFGNLRLLDQLLRQRQLSREALQAAVERALSWEPLIRDVDDA